MSFCNFKRFIINHDFIRKYMKKIFAVFVFLFFLSFFFISSAFSQEELSEEEKQQILSDVEKCIHDVNECNCSKFGERGEAFCNNITSGVLACFADFKSEKCQSIDPTKVKINGISIKDIVIKRVQQYDKQITECIKNGESCDCSQFPKSLQEFCQNKVEKQKDCLENYNLNACIELENPNIKIFPDFTPQWIINILDPIIRPLVQKYQESKRNFAIGSAMKVVGTCFSDPYNCDCSQIDYLTIRADCMERAKLMKTCLEYRDCAISNQTNCEGMESCTALLNMPILPEVTPGFIKPFIKPIVLKYVCPMLESWPYDKGNYAICDK